MALFLDLCIGDQLLIGDAVVSLEDKSGKRARIKIDADRTIPIKLVDNTTLGTGMSQYHELKLAHECSQSSEGNAHVTHDNRSKRC